MALFGPPNVDRMIEREDVRGLVRALDYDRDPAIRRQAAGALGSLGDERAVAPLISTLADSDVETAREAAHSLGLIGDPRAADALIAVMGNRREELGLTALEALGGVGGSEAVGVLLEELSAEEGEWQRTAIEALAQVGEPAIEPLLRAQPAMSSETRAAAARALRQMEEGPTVSRLRDILLDASSPLRRQAAAALGDIASDAAVETLIEGLGSRDFETRPAAAAALAAAGPAAVEALIDALQSENRITIRTAIETLGKIGDPRAVGPLSEVMSSGNPIFRDLAAASLAQIGDQASLEPLVAMLGQTSWTSRRQAAEALGRLNDQTAIPHLVAALNDPEIAVRRAAAESLRTLRWRPAEEQVAEGAAYYAGLRQWVRAARYGEPAVEPLVASLRDAIWEDREAPTRALIDIGESAVTALMGALQDRDSGVRHSAAFALGEIGDPQAQQSLLEKLSDSARDVRAAAARALGKLGDPASIASLIDAFDDDPVVRRAAEDALGMIGRPAVEPLLVALNAESVDIRIAAINALGAIGASEAAEPLVDQLTDDEERVRRAAATALIAGGPAMVPTLIERLPDAEPFVQTIIAAVLGEIRDTRALPVLYTLLWNEDSGLHLAAAAALESIWAAQTSDLDTSAVSELFVMTFTPEPSDDELQRWLIGESLSDLAQLLPGLLRVHTRVMTDQSRLHETYEELPDEGLGYEEMVERFRAWVDQQIPEIHDWERAFFHREITMADEPPETDIVFIYYHTA